MRRLRPFLSAALVVPSLLAPPLAMGDDTEVFFARAATDAAQSANVFFMFDISGSMGWSDTGEDGTRMTRLKKGMLELLETVDGVNIGIGSFNGSREGGAVLHPTLDPDTDLCPDGACTAVSLRVPVRDGSDDAEENGTGAIDLYADVLNLTEQTVDTDTIVREFTIAAGSDDVAQTGPASLDVAGDYLPFFHDFGFPANAAQVGLRFTNIDIPAAATVTAAHVEFRTWPDSEEGDQSGIIGVDATGVAGIGSPGFADLPGLRVADRLRLDTVDWEKIPGEKNDNVRVRTPDISSLIGARMAEPDWSVGDALSLLFEVEDPDDSDHKHYRHFRSFEQAGAAKLVVEYTGVPLQSRRIGLRFAGVNIPRGASVTSAVVEFNPVGADSYSSEILVSGQAVGHAPTFATPSGDISSRARTVARVTWEPGSWNENYGEQRSAELAPIIEEIVQRGDWCGGNALALVFEGAGLRRARSRDWGVWDAPVLKLTYDPSGVDSAATCTSHRVGVAVADSLDDAEEHLVSGTVATGGSELRARRGTEFHLDALRFRDIAVPAGAEISSARLKLVGAGSDDNYAGYEIAVEQSGDAAPFAGSETFDLSARGTGAATVSWDPEPAFDGERLVSADIASLIESVVQGGAWSEGNALVVTLRQSGGSGFRAFRTFEADEISAARLEINYRLDTAAGDALPSAGTPLRTARDDMIDTILAFQPRSGTPLVDAYYESALYMLGEPVDFGRTRGQQTVYDRYYEISTPASYSGGTVMTPPDCDAVDPHSVACVDKMITGSPIYDAPPSGACHANQIVLLSDGQTTRGDTESRIRGLTGIADCEARSNTRENCAFELSGWLNDESAGPHASILTHTVGFNFSSDFLRTLAERGGGRFQEAGSASELASVFRTLTDAAAEIDTSFVAPAVTLSQLNRTTSRDDVYFAMFRPSLSARWDGNLKRYRLFKGTGEETAVYVDALSNPIVDPVTGNIKADARSFWTNPAAPDGPDVAAGGAANELTLSRNLLTYRDAADGPTALESFHEDNPLINALALGIGTDTVYRTQLLQWARGVDVHDIDGDGNTSEVRMQMGDPMHSTPFIFNYPDGGVDDAARSIVYVGTNEGFLHAIDTESGGEVFGFIPPKLLPRLEHFFLDQQGLDRPYGLDGPVSGWIDDQDGDLVVDAAAGERAYLYVGMRRGGRNYYALDVTDPEAPSLAWVIEGGTGDFAELGQSWSRMTPARIRVDGTERNVLVFGAGYDPVADERTVRGEPSKADGQGRGIYVVDAATGERLAFLDWSEHPGLSFAIPSDVRVVDVDLDGFADMFWVGDMGGRLWRFDLLDTSTGALGSAIEGGMVADFSSVGTRDNRRFHYPPDLALVRDGGGKTFLNVAIGSGWRAHPLDRDVDDRFYALRTVDIYGPPRDADGIVSYPLIGESDLFDVTTESARDSEVANSADGWFLRLEANGEKVLGSAMTVDNQILFTTYLPDVEGVGECGVSVGGGRIYALDALYGDAVLDFDGVSGLDGELTDDDRFKSLGAVGIPVPVSAMIAESDPERVTAGVGVELLEELESGQSLKRTYWTER